MSDEINAKVRFVPDANVRANIVGQIEERRSVVAWLRDRAKPDPLENDGDQWARAAGAFADAIERGVHVSDPAGRVARYREIRDARDNLRRNPSRIEKALLVLALAAADAELDRIRVSMLPCEWSQVAPELE